MIIINIISLPIDVYIRTDQGLMLVKYWLVYAIAIVILQTFIFNITIDSIYVII